MTTELSNITENTFINEVKGIVEQGRNAAYGAVNAAMIETYWRIGQRIVEQEQNGSARAEYGRFLIKTLSIELTHTYGRGWGVRTLHMQELSI